jgi:hypothetical protein
MADRRATARRRRGERPKRLAAPESLRLAARGPLGRCPRRHGPPRSMRGCRAGVPRLQGPRTRVSRHLRPQRADQGGAEELSAPKPDPRHPSAQVLPVHVSGVRSSPPAHEGASWPIASRPHRSLRCTATLPRLLTAPPARWPDAPRRVSSGPQADHVATRTRTPRRQRRELPPLRWRTQSALGETRTTRMQGVTMSSNRVAATAASSSSTRCSMRRRALRAGAASTSSCTAQLRWATGRRHGSQSSRSRRIKCRSHSAGGMKPGAGHERLDCTGVIARPNRGGPVQSADQPAWPQRVGGGKAGPSLR